MSYIPHDYWFNRGKTYKKEFRYNKNFELQEKILIDYLTVHLSSSSFSTVLEVGCGFGRITKLLLSNFPHIREYLAIDLSPDQIENAKELIKPEIEPEVQVPNITFLVSDIQSFQIQKKYDLVVASEVLMHILPSEIAEVMSKLISMSNEHIVNIDWYEQQPPSQAAPHNFIHQYEKLYRNMPEVLNVYRIPIMKKGSWLKSVDTKQCLFHATKKLVK
jgi:trans-aconitate methyltransferase